VMHAAVRDTLAYTAQRRVFGRPIAEHELARLEDQEGARERLRLEERRLWTELDDAARQVSAARNLAAADLAERVNAELPPLGLPASAFGVTLNPGEIGPSGMDRVEFTFAPNPGEPPRPLARIVSGGEASRLSLAVKVVLAAADDTPLLVFDDCDLEAAARKAAGQYDDSGQVCLAGTRLLVDVGSDHPMGAQIGLRTHETAPG